MRAEGSPLDLNNLPEEYGKQPVEESSTTTAASADTARFKKKKGGAKDESGKIYECRFCSLKFGKSQALGGHMNRHRQERETETLNRARQLVFGNDGMSAVEGAPHMGLSVVGGTQSLPPGSFHHGGGSLPDPCLSLRPVYPRPPTAVPPRSARALQPPYVYKPSSSHHPVLPYPAPYPGVGDYFIGHALTGISQPHGRLDSSSYTCFGGPLVHSFPSEGAMASRDGAPSNHMEGMNWNSSHGQHRDPSPPSDRFRDNF